MKLAVPRELREDERRVALVPESVKKFVKAGLEVTVERGAGERSFFGDEAYQEAGATLESDAPVLLANADLVLKVNPPVMNAQVGLHEVDLMRPGSMLLTTLLPMLHTINKSPFPRSDSQEAQAQNTKMKVG